MTKPIKQSKTTSQNAKSSPLKQSKWNLIDSAISKDFPVESLQVNSARTGTQEVGYKPQYIVERLNKVFGKNHWRTIEVAKEVGQSFAWMKIELQIGHYDKNEDKTTGITGYTWIMEASREAYGGCRIVKANVPDALKGAQTDAIKKAASMFDIGSDAYKGLISADDVRGADTKRMESKAKESGYTFIKKPDTQQVPKCPKCDATMVWRNSKRGPFWGCSSYPQCDGLLPTDQVNADGSVKESANGGGSVPVEEVPF